MRYQPLCCWDCGAQVIQHDHGHFTAAPILRQVKFSLSGGAYSEHPFCQACAEKAWTPERIAEFKAAVDTVASQYQAYRIVAVIGQSQLTEPIGAIV